MYDNRPGFTARPVGAPIHNIATTPMATTHTSTPTNNAGNNELVST